MLGHINLASNNYLSCVINYFISVGAKLYGGFSISVVPNIKSILNSICLSSGTLLEHQEIPPNFLLALQCLPCFLLFFKYTQCMLSINGTLRNMFPFFEYIDDTQCNPSHVTLDNMVLILG